MNQQDDRTFLKKFSGIVIGLMVVTVAIVIFAISMQNAPDPAENPSQMTNVKARIAPVAGVHTSEESKAAVASTAPVAQPPTASPAEPAAIDGSKVYGGLCQSCHTAGVAGAPMPGSDLMKERAANGIDSMVANAIKGIGIMPPRGGNSKLSDDEIRAAVEYMTE